MKVGTNIDIESLAEYFFSRLTMKIVLDTNAFYAVLGEGVLNICKNEKIKRDKFKELLSEPRNEIVISTVTIYEFLVKFREEPEIIRYGLTFIKENVDKIHYSGYLPFSVVEIDDLLLNSEHHLKKKIEIYKEKKIDLESRFAAIFLGFLICQYTLSYIGMVDEDQIDEKILRVFRLCIPENVKNIQKKFVVALRDGYNTNDVERIIKDRFNLMLNEVLLSWTMFLESVLNNPSLEINNDDAVSAEFRKLYAESPDVKKFLRYQSNINEWIAKLDKRTQYKASRDLAQINKLVFCSKNIQGIQIEYIEWIMLKMGQRNAKFKKNDISDMLILTVLNDSDSVLITFDKDAQDFIASKKNVSLSYIDRVYDRL